MIFYLCFWTYVKIKHLRPAFTAFFGYIIAVAPEFAAKITFVEGKLENFDAVIATGSNNTALF
jgi:hypothetical protein